MSSGKKRLDVALAQRGMVATRSQAESYIKLGRVKVNGKITSKPSLLVGYDDVIEIRGEERYVSRGALKLESIAGKLGMDFKDKVVLDVGSSTGGFTDYALQKGARKVIAVDAGTEQMNALLRKDERVELHEKTDIRSIGSLSEEPDIVLIDVSFTSLRLVLPAVVQLITGPAIILALCKPQFEAGSRDVHKGVVKNDTIRRRILRDFENWAKDGFLILDKADSEVSGARGNKERFYLMRPKSWLSEHLV